MKRKISFTLNDSQLLTSQDVEGVKGEWISLVDGRKIFIPDSVSVYKTTKCHP